MSPLLLADRHDRDLPELLAGEIMGDFGGFADRRLRRSDFALGYDCLLAWLPEGLGRVDVADDIVATAVDAVERGRRAEWAEVEMGHAGVSDLPTRNRLALLRLGLHTLRVIGNDVWRIVRR